MKYLIYVTHPETGSSTSIGGETEVDALRAVVSWLGAETRTEFHPEEKEDA